MDFIFIFLIISSNGIEQYLKMKQISNQYHNLFRDKIKHFYIELKPHLDTDILEENEHIYVKGTESLIPGILYKTQKAMEYINSKYNYKYLVRTNLSSFWDLNNLLLLSNKLPLSNIAFGHLPFNSFISGTSIIMSKDIAFNIIPLLNINHNIDDDVYISLKIQQNFSISDVRKFKFDTYYLVNNSIDLPTDNSNILFYRIKNSDRNIDVHLFENLFKKLYDIKSI
jgi:hypothetical protein